MSLQVAGMMRLAMQTQAMKRVHVHLKMAAPVVMQGITFPADAARMTRQGDYCTSGGSFIAGYVMQAVWLSQPPPDK